MNLREAITGVLLLAGCGPGTGGSSDGGSTGGGTTAATDGATTTTGAATGDGSGGATGTSEATATPTTGGTTGATSTTTAGTTGATSTTTAGTTTGATTGELTCDDVVGSLDCALLAEFSGELTVEECEMCQGAACGANQECDEYPCVDGKIVVRGCCTDRECADLSPFCGMFIATNNVCVVSDDI
jgi:hypothetical protein